MSIERIDMAAIEYNGVVWRLFPPNRHHNIIRLMACRPDHCASHTTRQGFYTTAERFVDRREAYEIALRANQIVAFGGSRRPMLFSEDLW